MSRDTRSLQQLQGENEQLKQALQRIQQEHRTDHYESKEKQPQTSNVEFERRVEKNEKRIQELQRVLSSQQEVIKEYKERFKEFEDNLVNVMKLDKDIHSRLVNPQSSAALQSNVKNVLIALNGKAPYDKLIKMLQSIKV